MPIAIDKIKACITPETSLITGRFICLHNDRCEYCAVGKILSCGGMTDEQLLELEDTLETAESTDAWWETVFSNEHVKARMKELNLQRHHVQEIISANDSSLYGTSKRVQRVLERIEDIYIADLKLLNSCRDSTTSQRQTTNSPTRE